MKNKTGDAYDQPITMRFRKGQIKILKAHARKVSYEKNLDLSYVDLIRQAIEKIYPIEKK